SIRDGPKAQRPRANCVQARWLAAAPRVSGQSRLYLRFIRRAHHEEDLPGAVDGTAKDDEAVPGERIHELGVDSPPFLLLHRARIVPARAARPCRQEEPPRTVRPWDGQAAPFSWRSRKPSIFAQASLAGSGR